MIVSEITTASLGEILGRTAGERCAVPEGEAHFFQNTDGASLAVFRVDEVNPFRLFFAANGRRFYEFDNECKVSRFGGHCRFIDYNRAVQGFASYPDHSVDGHYFARSGARALSILPSLPKDFRRADFSGDGSWYGDYFGQGAWEGTGIGLRVAYGLDWRTRKSFFVIDGLVVQTRRPKYSTFYR